MSDIEITTPIIGNKNTFFVPSAKAASVSFLLFLVFARQILPAACLTLAGRACAGAWPCKRGRTAVLARAHGRPCAADKSKASCDKSLPFRAKPKSSCGKGKAAATGQDRHSAQASGEKRNSALRVFHKPLARGEKVVGHKNANFARQKNESIPNNEQQTHSHRGLFPQPGAHGLSNIAQWPLHILHGPPPQQA